MSYRETWDERMKQRVKKLYARDHYANFNSKGSAGEFFKKHGNRINI